MGSGKLGAQFPYEHRKRLADENFKAGSVLKFFCLKANKEKYFVFAGNKYDKTTICLIHINSEINPHLFPTPALRNEHILLPKSEIEFLDHDSYANCSEFIIRTTDEIYNLLLEDPGKHIADLPDEYFQMIKEKICRSKILRPDYKKEYGLFFC